MCLRVCVLLLQAGAAAHILYFCCVSTFVVCGCAVPEAANTLGVCLALLWFRVARRVSGKSIANNQMRLKAHGGRLVCI